MLTPLQATLILIGLMMVRLVLPALLLLLIGIWSERRHPYPFA